MAGVNKGQREDTNNSHESYNYTQILQVSLLEYNNYIWQNYYHCQTLLTLLRRIAAAANHSNYCHTFLRSAVCMSVCQNRAPCSNCWQIYMPVGRYTCGVQGHTVLDGGPWPPGERGFGV